MNDDHSQHARKTTGLPIGARDAAGDDAPHSDVRTLARQAVRVMASESKTPPGLPEHRLNVMCKAFLDEHDDPRHLVMLGLRQNGVSLSDIIDHVVPEIARGLGTRWADDAISFADVTIGTARLQETVRTLSAKDQAWNPINVGPQDAADPGRSVGPANRVLMIIPRPEEHTLGVFVAADQLRRMGYTVDIAMDEHPQQIARRVKHGRYVMIGITAAGRRSVASARELVDIIRPNVTRVTPIVLGGSILETESDLRRITGADFVAPDMVSALRLCGLETSRGNALLEVGADSHG
jgi:methylmalonyl-CoA mutase cobalamin-binding subunit